MGHDDQPSWRRAATHTLHTALLLKAALEERLQDAVGMLLADHEALNNLRQGPLRMSDIADRLILSRGGTTKVIDRLEDIGFVERSPDPADRRATIVTITQAGIAAADEARAVVDETLEATWASRISDSEAAMLVDIMSRLAGRRDP